jgi:hypothetical protein
VCSTQLRTSVGGVVGLDYPGCKVILELYDQWTPEIVRGLRIIERAFLTHLERNRSSSAGHGDPGFNAVADDVIDGDLTQTTT